MDTVRVALPPAWQNGPAPNPDPRPPIPDPYHVMQWVVGDAYWDVLAWRQDGMETEARDAEAICLARALRLRDVFDSHPKLGPAAADAAIAWAIRAAERRFAADLANEKRRPWRAQRGRDRGYF